MMEHTGKKNSLNILHLGIVDSDIERYIKRAGWSSPVARQAHNLKVVGSNPTPATKYIAKAVSSEAAFCVCSIVS